MLIYHPAFDVNHCLYRILLVLESSVHRKFDWDLLRLMDFYILFPHLLKSISPFPSQLKPFKKIVEAIPEAYEVMSNTKRVLFELEAIQNAAIQNLVAKMLVDVENFRNKIVTRTDLFVPDELSAVLKNDTRINAEWFRFIINELPLVDFSGKSGLKSRSKLMEYKYDALV